jgi:hypothetical protein
MKPSTHFRIQAAAAGTLALGGGTLASVVAYVAGRVHTFAVDFPTLLLVFAVGFLYKGSFDSAVLAITSWRYARDAEREGY